jgi:hypothetical protein
MLALGFPQVLVCTSHSYAVAKQAPQVRKLLIKVASALFLLAGVLSIARYLIGELEDRASLYLGVALLVVTVGMFYSPKIEKALGISRNQRHEDPIDQPDDRSGE